MNVKKKRTLIILFVGIIVAIGIGIAIPRVKQDTVTASAATTPKYSIAFCYEHSYTYGSGGGTNTTKKTGTDVYASDSVQCGASSYCTVSVLIYGNSTSGTGTLPNGGYINFTTVTIEITSNFSSPSIVVKNSAGTTVGSKSGKSLTLTGLSNGKYNVSIVFGSAAWTINSRAGASVRMTGTCSFNVDTVAPTISGASTSTTGKYTNKSFTVTASDSGSGVGNLFVLLPGVPGAIPIGTSYTLLGTGNGLYRFYAIDKSGNASATYYVYYDNTPPTGIIKNTAGTELGAYTNEAFSYTATDEGSGIDYLEYKHPSTPSWVRYTAGQKISLPSPDGTYSFRARDKCGNISAEKSVELDTIAPTGILYAGTQTIQSGRKTNAAYIKFFASDSISGIENIYVKKPGSTSYVSYVNNSQYTIDGTYSFYCTDKAKNVSPTHTVILDKTPPILSCSETSFYSSTGQSFTVSASDEIGTAKLYLKAPGMSEYVEIGVGNVEIRPRDADGIYYFYAQDDMENRSAVYWVELSVEVPKAQLVRASGSNKVCVTWTEDCSATINGRDYVKGIWLAEEGEYTVVLTSNVTGRRATYTFSITHYYVVDETVTPTCVEQGYTVYRCTSCWDRYNSNFIPANGHQYKDEHILSTCIDGGYIKHVCTVCGDTYETDRETALGHKYTEQSIPPTCTEAGGIQHLCTVCGYSYLIDEQEPTGHDYISEVIRSSTCIENGERRHICENCGDEYVTIIPAFGHTYEITDEKKEGEKTLRTYTCTLCGDSYTEDLGNQYEKVTSYIEYLFNLYSPYMIWVFLGTSGVWSVAMGVAMMIARKNEEKEKAKRMLVNYGIGLIVIFAILVACPYLVRGIAVLIT